MRALAVAACVIRMHGVLGAGAVRAVGV